MIRLIKYLLNIRLIRFMLVGSIAFIVSIAIYYPLTLILETQTTILGQHFYLPATLISTPISLACAYYIHRKYTFGDCKEKRYSLGRYMFLGMSTAVLDVVLLWILVDFVHIYYLFAAIMAVLIMFITRYIVSTLWIWSTHDKKIPTRNINI